MPLRKQIELLLAKVDQDEYVLDKFLTDKDAPIEVFGFHAQQVAEKLLKVVLAVAGADYPRTHRLVELLDLVKSCEIVLPEHFEEVRYLTPFAVEFRYDVFPEESEELLDNKEVRQLLKELRLWVDGFIGGHNVD